VSDVLLQRFYQGGALKLTVIKQQPYDVMQCCDAIMTTSGTASLEIALLGVPMLIAYKLSPLTYYVGRLLIHTPFIGLPNIIAGKAVVKELIQQQATAENLAAEVDKLLTDADYRQAMCNSLQHIKQQLGQGGGSKNMARLALEMLDTLEVKATIPLTDSGF
jgi:lipid-A-disaccharide synthase